MKFYIKERHNPQLDKPYYVLLGKLSKNMALKHIKNCIYGSNNLLSFENEKEYTDKIDELKFHGFQLH
jgi:hypothetical protein